MTPKPRVLLGMSGGVDSSVSAALLLEAGYEVIGAFMKNWSGDVCGSRAKDANNVGEEFQECGWKEERRAAARVAAKLGIPFLTLDFETEYRRDVVEYMFAEFEKGRTPNPDVMCNKFVKFDVFVKEADRLGCAYIATGHYARVRSGETGVLSPSRRPAHQSPGDDGTVAVVASDNTPVSPHAIILKGVDTNKDQSYFLWAIDPAVIHRVLFPIGEMTKPEVRQKARELGLDNAEKKDSVGICFVGEVDMSEFLLARISEDPGPIVTTEGKVIGTHRGINFYTHGQRHGLNVGGGAPYYVVDKRPKTKELIVSSNYHPSLYKKSLTASKANWFDKEMLTKMFDRTDSSTFLRCQSRIRYRQEVQDCTIVAIDGDRVGVEFLEPQRAVTPGQSIVFYDGDIMLGGAIID